MIGGTLVRFRPDKINQSGDGFGATWKDIKKRGPTILRDVLTETAMEGLKGLNAGGKGKKAQLERWTRRGQERSDTGRET